MKSSALIPPNFVLPDDFPWGVALIARWDGSLLKINKHLRAFYCEPGASSRVFADLFNFRGDLRFEEVAACIADGESWSGRVEPKYSIGGISTVEIVLQEDPGAPSYIWLYTMEHPTVDHTQRLSSRSEMQLLQVLLDNTLEYVFFRDTAGRFIITNKAFREAVASDVLLSTKSDTIGAFVDKKTADWVAGIDAQIRESGDPVVNEVAEFEFRSGTRQWLQITTVPVVGEAGALVGSVSVARDVSDLKEKEIELRTAIRKANHASRAKGEFLAAMSHEIRTPINGIIGSAELSLDTRMDAEQRAYLKTIKQCGDTLLALVNDVLDFSKIEAGQLSLEKLTFEPAALLEDVADEFKQVTEQKGLELVVANSSEVPRYLVGDPTRLKQIFYNLVGNAVKFTEEGEIIIRTELVGVEGDIAQLELSVSDTGIGIDSSRMGAIFSSFTQADMSTSRKYGGTGLGLAICKELVNLMGGEIDVESALGQGATFRFKIPFSVPESRGAEALPFHPELAGLRVLIVDDNEASREVYKKMCAGWGYRSTPTSEALEALFILEEAAKTKDPYRLVILDQQMHGITGLDLASLIQSRPNLKDVKMLLFSSSLDHAESERADELGIDRTLSKPVKRVRLLEVILEIFKIKSARPQDANSKSDPSDRTVLDPEAAKRLRVLIAEDNPINQTIARRRLEKLGHTTTVVVNGKFAVEAVRHGTFDCILMDVQMPEMDGYEATQEIRKYEDLSGSRSNYIVAMTAHAMKGDAEKCFKSGMNEYISKPFRAEDLKQVMNLAYQQKMTRVRSRALELSGEGEGSFAKRFALLSEEEREHCVHAAEIFVKTLPEDIHKFEWALRDADAKTIAFMAHTLKAAARVFENKSLCEVGQHVEDLCEEAEIEAVRRAGIEFIDGLHAFRIELLAALQAELA